MCLNLCVCGGCTVGVLYMYMHVCVWVGGIDVGKNLCVYKLMQIDNENACGLFFLCMLCILFRER